ncbi:dTDP-4-dehydrorhamnose reductase [Rubripirellula reticaptiva]|uniref:dTDP-4-dehydrorhamnose reductase n=1 Tax=Rubripirellula reticaptiva TaxID=2528013 RepID=A0A5C6FE45_9BACT|nr:dTDP-4-dehydrorhamnose reductase [Rubripirellula reticaptiva]TWU57899.1 dTDP-4-dehydrorhamnose reductase [Rubripirellula reticaptiva]
MIFVTGAAGQLGSALCHTLGDDCLALTRDQLDIADSASIEALVLAKRPDVIVNCAAYTAVDLAEDEVEKCRNINATAVKSFADAANKVGALLVQISTDYVYGGATVSDGANREDSPLRAQGVYAKTKLAGEEFAQTCANHLIIRTCGIYGHLPKPKNFVETMLRVGADRDELRVVDDQYCNPTSAATITGAILALIDSKARGVFNVAASPAMTWCDFAREIFKQADMPTKVVPITTEEFGAKAERPRYSVVDTSKYTRVTGKTLPTINDDLAKYLATRS